MGGVKENLCPETIRTLSVFHKLKFFPLSYVLAQTFSMPAGTFGAHDMRIEEACVI